MGSSKEEEVDEPGNNESIKEPCISRHFALTTQETPPKDVIGEPTGELKKGAKDEPTFQSQGEKLTQGQTSTRKYGQAKRDTPKSTGFREDEKF